MRLLTIMVLTLAAALARADWVDYEVPLIPYESVPNFLKYSPEMNLGEVLSVAVNSRGYIMVLNHPGSANNGGPLYRNATSQLLEFDPEGYFVREIGQNVYGFGYSHTIPLGWRRTSWPHLQAHPERHDPGCAGRDRPATGPVQLASRHRLLAGRRPVHSGYEQLAGAEADIESLTVAQGEDSPNATRRLANPSARPALLDSRRPARNGALAARRYGKSPPRGRIFSLDKQGRRYSIELIFVMVALRGDRSVSRGRTGPSFFPDGNDHDSKTPHPSLEACLHLCGRREFPV